MLVVDASVVVKWVTEEDGSDAATELLNMELAAPDLWLPEAANALWAKQHRGLIDVDHARDAVGDLVSGAKPRTYRISARARKSPWIT